MLQTTTYRVRSAEQNHHTRETTYMSTKIFMAISTLAFLALSTAHSAHADDDQKYRPVYSFDQVHGSVPEAELFKSKWAGRTLWGTTQSGGASNIGTLFRFHPEDNKLDVVHTFAQDGSDGFWPGHDLKDTLDGNLVGVTNFGGTHYSGTIYFVSPRGDYRVAHSFEGAPNDGFYPDFAPLAEPTGSFVGTTAFGGENNQGTVYRLAVDGTVTLLHSFSGPDGATPQFGMVKAPDNMYYGTTNGGGDNQVGTIFRISPDGAFESLISFSPSTTGVSPQRLELGRDGSIYGTAPWGGVGGGGTAFRLTRDGELTVIHSFAPDSAEGDLPTGLMQASDGNFYGTTTRTSSDQHGTLFRMTKAGDVTVMHKFGDATKKNPSEGREPMAPPVDLGMGVLFGTTTLGGILGQTGFGTIYRMKY
jgi:uncharacterized repeat protein (TIGR03803 family)